MDLLFLFTEVSKLRLRLARTHGVPQFQPRGWLILLFCDRPHITGDCRIFNPFINGWRATPHWGIRPWFCFPGHMPLRTDEAGTWGDGLPPAQYRPVISAPAERCPRQIFMAKTPPQELATHIVESDVADCGAVTSGSFLAQRRPAAGTGCFIRILCLQPLIYGCRLLLI